MGKFKAAKECKNCKRIEFVQKVRIRGKIVKLCRKCWRKK